ncbi:MAG: serine--tRNA ligase, partial [Clostridia bacterium]|nr:serine--tRNA ligase [Clostridia bacterium]
MLDIKLLRNDYERIMEVMKVRGESVGDIGKVLEYDEQRRQLTYETETLKAKQNEVSKQIPALKKEGKDVAPIFAEMKEISEKSKELDAKIRELDEKINEIMLTIPNIPHPSVPIGDTDEDNVEIRKFGTPTSFDFEAKAHWDIGEGLGIL